MLIGAMNHPRRDVLKEIEWIADMGLDFIDLTLEPPVAAAWKVDAKAIRRALEKRRLAAVGHTAYYLPLTSPFESIRRAAVEELKKCLEVFGELGVRWMNIHPSREPPMHSHTFGIERNLQTLQDLQSNTDSLCHDPAPQAVSTELLAPESYRAVLPG